LPRIKPYIRDGGAAKCKHCLNRKLVVPQNVDTNVDAHNDESTAIINVVDENNLHNCNVFAVNTRSETKSIRALLL
jgi:hypothetical protein